jgi:hypothetical protein
MRKISHNEQRKLLQKEEIIGGYGLKKRKKGIKT